MPHRVAQPSHEGGLDILAQRLALELCTASVSIDHVFGDMVKVLTKDGSKQRSNPYSGPHYLILFLACLTVLLLVAGALVTSNDAGDSVPDWPMSFGRWVLGSRQFVGNVRYEYSHRVIAGAVSCVTLVTAVWVWLSNRLRRFRWLALAALVGVLLQAGLGGIRVLFPGQKIPIAMIHALVAQSFFCLIVTLGVVTSSGWNYPRPVTEDGASPGLRLLSGLTIGAAMVQLLLGAGFRHGALGIGWHIGGAVLVSGLVIFTAVQVHRHHGRDRYLNRPALLMCFFLICQVSLGVAAYLARLASVGDPQPLEPMVSLTVAHLAVGALILASILVLGLRCYQTLAPPAGRGSFYAADQADSESEQRAQQA
jgi:cytochrome c oxidase assembly protein subunit 15